MKEVIPLYLNESGTLIKSEPFNGEKYQTFYAINPDFRPIPPGAVLFLATEKDGITTNFGKMYDPFNQDEKGVKFIAWYSDVPNTTLLYYGSIDGKVVFKLGNSGNLGIPDSRSIHVFTEKDLPVSFKENLGRCIPEKGGVSLSECVLTKNPPTILGYLAKKKDKTDYLLIFFFLAVFGVLLYLFLRKMKNG